MRLKATAPRKPWRAGPETGLPYAGFGAGFPGGSPTLTVGPGCDGAFTGDLVGGGSFEPFGFPMASSSIA